MFRLKSGLMLLAAVTMACALAACGSSSASSGTTTTHSVAKSQSTTNTTSTGTGGKKLPVIYYINPATTYALYNTSQKLFQEAAKKDGYIARVSSTTDFDTTTLVQLINEAVATKPAAIIFCDSDPKTFASTIKAAQKKGIVMVTTSCVDNISNYSVGTNNVDFGQVAAKTIASGAGTNAQVVVFAADGQLTNQQIQYDAFKAYAAKHYPKMKVLTEEFDNGDTGTAEQDLASLPESYPTANAIWFLNGQGITAVPEGLRSGGKKPGQMYVLGIDALPSTLSLIKQKWVSETLAQCYFWATPFAAQLALAKIDGHPVSKRSWPIGVQAVGASQLPYQGCPASYIPTIKG